MANVRFADTLQRRISNAGAVLAGAQFYDGLTRTVTRVSYGAPAMAPRHRRQWRDYRTAAGARPVKAFLDRLADDEVAAILAGMIEVEQRGLVAARHLRGDIYEVRADGATRSFRLLFSAEGRYKQVLLSLSVYEKRTQRIPARDLEVAEQRLGDWRSRGREN